MRLTDEPLFDRKERLYAAPEPGEMEEPPPPAPAAPSVVRRVLGLHVEPPKKQDVSEDVEESLDEDDEDGTGIRAWVSTCFELLGVASLATGGFLLAPWVGFMVLGALLMLFGLAMG